MLAKFVGAVSVSLMVFTTTMLWAPSESSAQYFSFKFPKASIDCEVTAAGGGPKTANDAVICAVNIKEISGFCRNRKGNSGEANGQPFRLQGSAVKLADSDAWVKTKNGLQTNKISITDQDIQRIVDIWNAEHPNEPIDLSSGSCPNPQWTFEGFFVTKADAVLTQARIPDPGSMSYQTTNCRTVTLPSGPETICDLAGKVFEDCNRTESLLEIKDGNGVVQDPQLTSYRMKNCYLWRDVNKDNAFNLSKYGSQTYQPDIDFIVPPQTGNVDGGNDDDLGGLVLVSPFVFYTGTCHQHAEETNQGIFQQLGPIKPVRDSSGNITSAPEPQCTGGSQLLDGTYP